MELALAKWTIGGAQSNHRLMQANGRRIWLAVTWLQLAAAVATAQTFSASALSHRSSGVLGGSTVTLSENGYVGTYFTLNAPGQVTLTVSASGATTDAVAPRMKISLADSSAEFDVASVATDYAQAFDLPAGTYFVRTEFNNDVPSANRQLMVGSLKIDGASSVSNTTNQTTNNTNALAAADSYIENYRKGAAKLALGGVAPGTEVHVKLKQHAFRFGTAVGGTTVSGINSFLNNTNYNNFLLENFNTITPGNAGKWAYNEATRDVVTMSGVDRLLDYAEQNDLNVRMHNLIWGDSQQPSWAATLLNNANSGNATAKNDLRGEISERIDHYIGNGDANMADDRARRIVELDVLNEHVHQAKYWNVYGAQGIADIYAESAAAVQAAGADTKLYLNEYNVLQYGNDSYGNWYRQDVEELNNLGASVSGIGVQYYPLAATGTNAHSPARINQIYQNFAVTGLPISLTEFGVQTAGGTTTTQAATYLTETMRMTFGMPDATTFTLWGFWANDVWNQAPLAALMDANWNLTPAGTAFLQLMSQWSTDVTLPVNADGTIDFRGFYGVYDVTIDGQTFELDLTKGQSQYSLAVAPGDYNGDGTVDAADYTIWHDSLGSTADLRADGNGNFVIDDGDLGVWAAAFGTVYGGGTGSIAVPEPAGVTLVGAIALVSALGLRSRNSRSRQAP